MFAVGLEVGLLYYNNKVGLRPKAEGGVVCGRMQMEKGVVEVTERRNARSSTLSAETCTGEGRKVVVVVVGVEAVTGESAKHDGMHQSSLEAPAGRQVQFAVGAGAGAGCTSGGQDSRARDGRDAAQVIPTMEPSYLGRYSTAALEGERCTWVEPAQQSSGLARAASGRVSMKTVGT